MLNGKVSSKHAFCAIRLMVYVLLLSLGIFFIHEGEVWERFTRKRTNFAIYTEDPTELPTMVIFLQPDEFKLGVDFNLTVQAIQSGSMESSSPPTSLSNSGLHPISVNEPYKHFTIEFEKNLSWF